MNSFKMAILTCSDLVVLFTKSTGSFKLFVFFHIVFLCSKNLPQWEQWNGFTSFHPRDMKGHYLLSQQAFANSVVNVKSLGWKLWWNHSTAPIVAKVSNATTQWTMQEHTTSKSSWNTLVWNHSTAQVVVKISNIFEFTLMKHAKKTTAWIRTQI